jgi:hypothetical protein
MLFIFVIFRFVFVLPIKKKIMITYIANTLFILFILFCVWFIVCSIIYRDKPSNDLTGQSERQKKNDDYNTDYHP